ncbi:MAG: exodeoxyribonuclease V subunit gamma [Chthoniobacterales bacterium]|nr:exodeoxyribonuclease V subunit gamma [Chthoniobacterales bacterium]
MSQNSGLHLHPSNRLELLADAMAAVLQRPLEDPFAAEAVVIPTLGLERWLTQQLALRQGICANISFLFPQKFVAGLMDAALPGHAAARFYARENLTWRIMKLLPELADRREFADPRRYLAQPRPELRRFQLAGKIASSFDQYLAFRPRMILDWERGGSEKDWQAILWRELARSAPGPHPPALAEEFSAALRRGAAPLPERVSVFGISTLPPFYTQFFQELAQSLELHLFVMRPTPEFWGDIRSEREETRARRKAAPSAQLNLQFARGNPLLASFGKLGREFLETITEFNPAAEHEAFLLPPNDSVLGQIQRDIYQLDDPTANAPRPVAPADQSLQFHSCHSPMREMEVLHDQLLALFEENPGLKPHDIVVMAPDISIYAPYINAVFDTAPERQQIPFRVADRGARAENGIVDTFLSILEVAGSRFAAGSVISILESAALQRRFELAGSDLEIIRGWIEKTGIRWGIDGAQRAALGLPAFAENSWRAGLDRLLLGYAAPAQGERLFEGILAFDEVEGSLAETLGRFVEFCEALFAAAGFLQHPRSLLEWQETLQQITARFFRAEDEREAELRQLRRVVDSLGETAQLSGYGETVPLDVLLAHLEQALASTESGSGFLVGCVTFCALKPMRTVPFRIVCLVGMNDTAYPRHDRAPGFNLIAQSPRPGDRSTRDDDRYLFLEALLSAREVFYVSYVGQSIRDNSSIPPSVLVSELLNYVQESFALPKDAALVRRHRLQPFSSAYFEGANDLFSFSTENLAASEAAAGKRHDPPPFISEALSQPESEWRSLDASQLIRFFGNPAKFLLEQRLNIRLPRRDELLEESEPFEINALTKYQLEQDLVTRALRGEALAPLLPVLRASGALPPGHAGDARLREMCATAEEFSDLVREHLGGGPEAPRDLQLALDPFTLRVRLDKFHDGRLVHYRLTTRKPKDLLTAWIIHLCANCAQPNESLLITNEKEKGPVLEAFAPVDRGKAEAHLRDLLQLYERGLCEPLRFFPRSALAYVEQTLRPKGNQSPLEKARAKWRRSPEKWEPDRGEKPEADDPHFAFAFRNVAEPLDEEFEQLALAIFAPLLKGRRS